MHSIDPMSIRDRTRRPGAKSCALSRKAARRAKVTRLFLCIAFDGPGAFGMGGEG